MNQLRDQKPVTTPAPQRKNQPPVRAEDAANQVASRSGSELPAKVRQPLESQFDVDFSDVRVHSDRPAAEAAAALGTRAFTVGRHIAFNEGEYELGSRSGTRLLAHELTHVVQQEGASVGRAEVKHEPVQEHEANLNAERAARGLAVQAGVTPGAGSVRIQADDGKGAESKKAADAPADQPAAGVTITFVMRAPDDAYTQDVTDYVQNTLKEQVVPVDNVQEAAEHVAKYAKDNKTKVSRIRIIGHGSTTGGIKMVPKGETSRRFVSAQELTDMAADQKLKATARSGMADGATVEFYGCYVGGTEETGKAVGSIFKAEFTAPEATLRTSSDSFARQAEKGEEGYDVSGRKGKWTDVKSTKEIDDRVAKGNKQLGDSFNKWLVDKARQMEADGDLAPQPDNAARIKAMREVFDRSSGKVKRLEIHTDKETVHRGDKQKWLNKWKTVKVP